MYLAMHHYLKTKLISSLETKKKKKKVILNQMLALVPSLEKMLMDS